MKQAEGEACFVRDILVTHGREGRHLHGDDGGL